MVEKAQLSFRNISLRLLRKRDVRAIEKLMHKDRAWLSPWEATTPGTIRYPLDIRWKVSANIRHTKRGTGVAWVILVDGKIAGQLNVANIQHGSLGSASIGYWVGRDFAGQNATPIACALAIDYLFDQMDLHRIEIDIRPENDRSLRVVEKLGLRQEGLKQRYIHIDGEWRDHLAFAITKEEREGSMLHRLQNTLGQ